MGEAKLRGSFEKRREEARAKAAKDEARREENRPKPLQRKMTALAVAAAMGAGSFFPRV